jgi:hypothetical protein
VADRYGETSTAVIDNGALPSGSQEQLMRKFPLPAWSMPNIRSGSPEGIYETKSLFARCSYLGRSGNR